MASDNSERSGEEAERVSLFLVVVCAGQRAWVFIHNPALSLTLRLSLGSPSSIRASVFLSVKKVLNNMLGLIK